MRPTRGLRRGITAAAFAATLMALAIPAAAATAARAPRPTVVALRASKIELTSTGGKITVTATVRHASRCSLSSKPGLHGLPARVSCTRGRAVLTVRLPANNGSAVTSYKLAATASGPGGTSATRSLTVRVLPAAPTVGLSASPDGLTEAGGTVSLTATVGRSARCVLSAVPEVPGLPATLPCAAGSWPAVVHDTVALPALAGSIAQPYAFTLKVTGPGGTATAAATETVWQAMSFSKAAPGGADSFTAVSCPAATFCAATDTAGQVHIYNGDSWTTGSSITPPGVALVSISCTSPTFCMAVDNYNSEYGSLTYVWNGKTWGSGGIPGIYLDSVSCSSATFCMVLGNLNTGVFASIWKGGTSWTSQTAVDSAAAYAQLSCVSSTFCAAIDQNGDAMTFNGTSWSSPDPIDAGVVQPLSAVSCSAATFCTALDGFGQAFTFNGEGWSGPVGVENSAGVTAVSCTSASFCAAADLSGNLVTDYGGTWSAPDNVDPQSNSNYYGFTGISCPVVNFCAAVDDLGNISLGTG